MRRNKKEEHKQLRKLSRADLLELLLEQTKKSERLEAETEELKVKIEELKSKIEEQRTASEEAASIAESARRLNGFVEKAEKLIKRRRLVMSATEIRNDD